MLPTMIMNSVMTWLNETFRKRFVDINETGMTYKTILKTKDFDLHKFTGQPDSVQMRKSNSIVSVHISVQLRIILNA